ncbi:MAG TPA: hypothetical protein VG937_03435 [Polyangiaceae bacterium]|nr:hypothetical protein [Polyangiaceae bacterium]
MTTTRPAPPEPESVTAAAEPASAESLLDHSEEEESEAQAGEQATENEIDLVSLPVPGFQAATLAVPRGDAPFRLVVAAHGAGGDPDATCSSWARRTRGRALIACPRGRAMSELEPHGFYYPDHHALEAEVLALVAASETRYAPRLVNDGAVYSGFSQGATMGALFLPARAARFSVLVLTEGGYGEWTRRTAQRFRTTGGERVLFVCGTRHCAASVAKSARVLESAGVTVRTETVSGGGHTDRGPVGERLDALVDWALSWQR